MCDYNRSGAAPEAIRVGKIVCAVLLTKIGRETFDTVHFTFTGAGAEAWRLVHAEYAGSSGARLGTVVRDEVCLREPWLAKDSAGKSLLTSSYSGASGDKINAVRVATNMGHVPELMKATLCQVPLGQRRSLDALKLWIRQASCVMPGLFQGRVPMQVNAVGDGAKERRAQARKKGKGKGKNSGKDGAASSCKRCGKFGVLELREERPSRRQVLVRESLRIELHSPAWQA